MTEPMILTVSGHRPPAYGGYELSIFERLCAVANDVLFRFQPEMVISGMALGWDLAMARAAAKIRLTFDAYIPFPEQDRRWTPEWQRIYHEVLGRARRIVVARERFPHVDTKRLYLQRDELMVDDGNTLGTMWDGRQEGGTFYTLKYAQKLGRPIYNFWPDWLEAQARGTPGS